MDTPTELRKMKKRKWSVKVVKSLTLTDNEKGKEKKNLTLTRSIPIPVPSIPARACPLDDPGAGAVGYPSSNSSSSFSNSPLQEHTDTRQALQDASQWEEFLNEGVSEHSVSLADEVTISGYEEESYRSSVRPLGFLDVEARIAQLPLTVHLRHALKNLSRSTPAMSPSVSPRHSDSEGPPRVSKGTKKFMRHFADAPPNEWVLNYFSCALVADILLQGTLFITPNFFAFYSKIFGHVSRLLIPVTQVETIQKERTAKIIPNAVGLHMVDGKTYVFGSLLSRDSTYKLMLHIWKKAQRMADSDSEPPLSVVQVAGEEEDDEVEDSVSGSAESEDHSDVAYVVTNPIPVLIGVPTLISTTAISSPWTRDSTITTTTANIVSSILPIQDIRIPSTTNSSSIPVNSLVGSAGSAAARQGSFSGAKSGSIVEEPRRDADAGLLQWVTQGSLVKTCFRMGRVPVKLVGEGIKELWALPRTSLLLIISTLLLLMLFASAAFMLHRVDILSQQLGLEKYDDYDGMYEEVLQMQQRLHAAASTEIEKTLSIQLKHIATVRQSLEALVVLFNKEPPMNTAQIPDNT
ncbi:uncharacterized protein [Procambarus clarkii]|uniref:uncharacterized protein isoform X4 n=1 Tax=Procambarus clarkii TaxID=6728 RepID=UPI001E676D0E|nr:uncharacterized protein LOC123745054 isoform X3 [Procambarus clarkii]